MTKLNKTVPQGGDNSTQTLSDNVNVSLNIDTQSEKTRASANNSNSKVENSVTLPKKDLLEPKVENNVLTTPKKEPSMGAIPKSASK